MKTPVPSLAVAFAAVLTACAGAAVTEHPTAHADPAYHEDPARDFDLGVAAYSRGEHAVALTYFTRANAARPSAVVLFDIARVHDAMGHDAEAARFYVRYLHALPDAPPDLVASVVAALDRLTPRLGWLLVRCHHPIDVDGEPVAADGAIYPVAVLPGLRELRMDGRATLALRIRPGDVLSVDVSDTDPPLTIGPASPDLLHSYMTLREATENEIALSRAGH